MSKELQNLFSSTSAALAFQDNKAAKETLFTLQGASDLLEAHLLLPDNTVFESYYPNKKSRIKKTKLNFNEIAQESITLSHVIIKKPIYLRSEFVGFLVLYSIRSRG